MVQKGEHMDSKQEDAHLKETASQAKQGSQNQGMDAGERPHRKRHIFASLVALVLVGGYLAGAWYYHDHTYPRTLINGKNHGHQPIATVITVAPTDAVFTFEGRDGHTLRLTEQTIDLTYTAEEDFPPQASSWLWPLEVWKARPLTIQYDVQYDQQRLNYEIQQAGFDPNGTDPEDAKVVVDAQGIRIEPEKEGTKINQDQLIDLILNAMLDGKTTLSVESAYVQPKRRKDDPELQKELASLQKLLTSEVDLKVGEDVYPFGPEQMYPLLTKDDSGTYQLPDTALRDFVADVARKTDTYGTDRKFESTGAGIVDVPPGIYGWQINVNETVDAIKKVMATAGKHEMEPSYRYEGLARGKLNDIGDTYIEIDLSRQHLWAYKNGSLLLDAGIRTGLVNNYNETPRGVHMIWSRERDTSLKGRSYASGLPYNSHVDFWMPVNYGGVGLHDASWVSSFGGDEYLYAGSNGCINLDHATAETIYNEYSVGTPVVIYESSTHYSPADKTF